MLVCFDYDGVLVDTFERLLSIAKRSQTLAGAGRPPTASDFRSIENLTFFELGRHIGLSRAQARDFDVRMFQLVREDTNPVEVFPGTLEMIRTLSPYHHLCVVTANTRHAVQQNLTRHGLFDCISLILDGEEPGTKADKIQTALMHFDTRPNHTVMVGDTRGDIRAGKTAGVGTIAVTWGYQSSATLAAEVPDFCVDVPADIVSLVQGVAR